METKETARNRRRSIWRLLRFFLLFAAVFLVLQRGYLRMRDETGNAINHRLNAVPAARIINAIWSDQDAQADDSTVSGRSATVTIKKGCEGFEIWFILISLMAAFPMGWKHRLLGLLTGTIALYTLNLVRIISLYYVSWRWPRHFDAAHIVVWQTIMIILSVLFFVFWIDRSQSSRTAAAAKA